MFFNTPCGPTHYKQSLTKKFMFTVCINVHALYQPQKPHIIWSSNTFWKGK